MSELRLRVNKYLDPDERGGPPPSVLATVYAIDPSTGMRVRGGKSERTLIPISHDPNQRLAMNVPAGRYFVEVAMPSGEVLSQQVNAKEKPVDVVLEAEDSSNEWMGWQQLVGNVLNAPAPVAKIGSAGPPGPGAGTGRSRGGKMVGTSTQSSRDVKASVGAPAMHVPTELHWLRTPIPALLPDRPGDPWKELAAFTRLKPRDIVLKLNGGQPTVPIAKAVGTEDRAIFRVAHGAHGVSSAVSLNSGLKRDFIAVPLDTSVELISVPAPWPSYMTFREAMIEIAVQRPAEPREFVSAVTVRDDRLAVLLGFLSSGALSVVKEMAEPAMEMLYGKMENPIAAAAGGYALVATATDTKDHAWHNWIENLCNRFPYMPDGAIQLATLRLRLRRTPADMEVARDALKKSYERGLPYYSTGLRWLLEGLERFANTDAEMDAMRENVQRIAVRSHVQSPFTILRFGDA